MKYRLFLFSVLVSMMMMACKKDHSKPGVNINSYLGDWYQVKVEGGFTVQPAPSPAKHVMVQITQSDFITYIDGKKETTFPYQPVTDSINRTFLYFPTNGQMSKLVTYRKDTLLLSVGNLNADGWIEYYVHLPIAE